MVQFGTKLHTNKVAKWAEHYVDYSELKRLIKVVVKRLEELNKRSVNLSIHTLDEDTFTKDDMALPSSRWPKTPPSIPEANPSSDPPVLDISSETQGLLANSDPAANSSEENIVAGKSAADADEPGSSTSRKLTLLDTNANVIDQNDGSKPGTPHEKTRSRRAWTSEESALLMPEKALRGKRYGSTRKFSSHLRSLSNEETKEGQGVAQQPGFLFDSSENIFVSKVKEEADRVNRFYESKLQEFQSNHKTLVLEVLNQPEGHMNFDMEDEDEETAMSQAALSSDSVKRVFRDLYRECNLLQNFAILNYTAFVKILKKYDKAIGRKRSKRIMRFLNERYEDKFIKAPVLHTLIESIESDYAHHYCHGDVTVARSELLLKQEIVDDWEMLHIGLRMGMIIVLTLWVIWDVAIDAWLKPDEAQLPPEISRIFRGFGFFVIGLWLWSTCVYVWTTERVHYIYLFEFDPRRTLLPTEMVSKACMVTMTYLFLFLMYIKIARGEIYNVPPTMSKYVPLALFAYMFLLLIFPVEQNATLLNAILRTVLAPSQKVTFFYSFVGDVLTSLTKPLVDIGYTLCFFFSGDWHRLYDTEDSMRNGLAHGSCESSFVFARIFTPIIIAAPLILRMIQNMRRYYDTGTRFPHLLNAFKYAFSNVIVLLGALHPSFNTVTKNTPWYKSLWVAAFVLSTCFTYFWDVYFDWGLCRREFNGLREHTMIPDRRYYYIAMVLDLVLRFAWCFTLIPQINVIFGISNQAYTTFFLGTTELVRRALWSIIRVEYEHQYNNLDYRRVDLVPLDIRTGIIKSRSQRQNARLSVYVELASFGAIVLAFCIIAVETSGDA
ncbi:Xenotropic and polytropic retrovirus receptor 1-like [Hondaea fermentalgiana]|uniref:Xenotropic and polytropic retrovirus receptor 1-like n=1 Tax=Hondaea fermentalgiana TaxID=2315210 RepID=A0A2R5GR61_9STRA|nr:Xenotropic and polytropic retrovirus receptor 1-like [Hondaea fermentalgiana]|eukprot:GBG32248.1 Xenotropic and polytropic retrovirus receptor 1-like [Hondaea fermentalgiana]